MDDITYIIQKKLNNRQLSSQEEEAFGVWVSATNNQDVFNDYKKVWDLSGSLSQPLTPDINLQWTKFKEKIESKKQINKLHYFINYKFAAAATLVIVLGLVVFLKFFSGSSSDVYFSDNSTLEIKLPDNSVVVLNKYSSIIVPKHFNKKSRTVKLTGEAVFNVTKNKAIPFVVETNKDIAVRVLGTVFNLRAYNNSNNFELKVLSGKVLFYNKSNNIEVVKGKEVDYSMQTGSFTEVKSIDANLLAWKTHELSFDNTPINDIIIALERFLDKKIQLPPNSSDIRYTGSFANPTDKDVAVVLSLAMGWDYKISDDAILFFIK